MWKREAISDGELDALRRVADAACNEDTRYPAWHGRSDHAGGHCYVISRWLVHRLGGSIGQQRGHYVWLSPDSSYYLDLTGGHRGGVRYLPNDGRFRATDPLDNVRTERFTKRADRIFDSLERVIRLSLDYAGDSHPASEPQAEDDSERFNDSSTEPESYWHDEPGDPTKPAGLYNFVWANGQLEVSPTHSHDELAGHAGIVPAEHGGPFAAGHVVITNGQATWEVQANVNLHSFLRILKDATKQYGWQWGGMTDAQGQPITDDFAPKKSATTYHYTYLNDHLYIGPVPPAILALSSGASEGRAVTGTVGISGERATVDPHAGGAEVLPALFEWATTAGLTLYAANDNVIKTIPNLELKDNYDPQTQVSPNPEEPPPVDERLPSGLYRCPGCERLFPNWHEYQQHRPACAEWGNWDNPEDNGDGNRLPEPDHGLYGDGAHFTEMRQEPGITTGSVVVLPARTWKEAARVDGFAKYATPFKYDNDNYSFYVAYRNGDPLGYVVVGADGYLPMMYSAVENQGIGKALYSKLTKHFDSLYTGAAHEKTVSLLKRQGWVESGNHVWRWSKDKAPTDMLDASLPFIYDVDKDKVFVGHPGARTSDIPGRFTPGGIVEGSYEPGGKMVIRSLTSVPYTVAHAVTLWYYSQPTLEVKSVWLMDDAGKTTRLAKTSVDIGQQIKQYAAIDPAAHVASSALQQAGGQVFVVGGAVRDAVMGKEPKDIDLMVTGLPAEKVSSTLQSLPGRVDYTGKDFGVFRYRNKGNEVEVALPRTEHSTGAGHQDFVVKPDHTMGPDEDFSRRDFTANAMGVNLATGQLVDPFNGVADIASRTLRTLSAHSLAEDPLRVVRALVAHARHGLTPDEDTRAQMAGNAHVLQHLPAERIQQELDKLMSADNPVGAIRLAHETGVLKQILPEVDEAFGYDQNNPHHERELGDHLLSVLDRTSQKTKDPDLRLAALLHDIGKPKSAWQDPETGTNHYYEHHLSDGTVLGANHETVGAELTNDRMRALKYPTDRIKRVSELVNHHMWPAFTTDRGARRFLARVGPHADDLMTLRWADQGGKSESPTDPLSLDKQRRLVSHVREHKQPTDKSALAINGNDLIAAGIPQGPMIGFILGKLTEQVIDHPSMNNPQTLLQLAHTYARMDTDVQAQDPKDQEASQAEEVQFRRARKGQLRQASEGDEDPQVGVPEHPEFPDIDDAIEAHDAAVEMSGQPHAALRDPSGLESALGRAENHWYYGDPSQPPHERLMQSAAMMGHGVAQRQAFEDGNKRTAYWLMHGFLANNGMPHVLRADDPEMANTIVGWGNHTHGPEHMVNLWRQRHEAQQ